MPELMAGDYAENAPYLRIMEREARARGCLRGGGNVDYDRIAAVMLNDFRAAKMGRITLEKATV